ncbi:MAG: hypothetical protein AAGF11_05785 [Myxococcota bacterium]
MPYIPTTPMQHNRSSRPSPRAPFHLLGRPIQNPWRRNVLDDDLLGSEWRWDSDDSKATPTTH